MLLCKTDPVKHLCVLAGSALSPAHVWHDSERAGANRGAHWGEGEPVRVKSKLWPLGVPIGPSQQVQRIVRTISVLLGMRSFLQFLKCDYWIVFSRSVLPFTMKIGTESWFKHKLQTESLLSHKSNINLPAVKRQWQPLHHLYPPTNRLNLAIQQHLEQLCGTISEPTSCLDLFCTDTKLVQVVPI